jgi:catechol 2,3-dioxygenase-like lactoylglutathione lyase family enzyme
MMEPRLSLVTLGVTDLARSAAFYERLGWTRVGPAEGVAFFQLGPLVLSLYPRENLAHDIGIAPFGEGFSGITLAYNVRAKEDVDTVVDAWVAAGGTITRAPFTADWGGHIAYVADPDGHLWEIAHNPGFPLDEAGGLHVPTSA